MNRWVWTKNKYGWTRVKRYIPNSRFVELLTFDQSSTRLATYLDISNVIGRNHK